MFAVATHASGRCEFDGGDEPSLEVLSRLAIALLLLSSSQKRARAPMMYDYLH